MLIVVVQERGVLLPTWNHHQEPCCSLHVCGWSLVEFPTESIIMLKNSHSNCRCQVMSIVQNQLAIANSELSALSPWYLGTSNRTTESTVLVILDQISPFHISDDPLIELTQRESSLPRLSMYSNQNCRKIPLNRNGS